MLKDGKHGNRKIEDNKKNNVRQKEKDLFSGVHSLAPLSQNENWTHLVRLEITMTAYSERIISMTYSI